MELIGSVFASDSPLRGEAHRMASHSTQRITEVVLDGAAATQRVRLTLLVRHNTLCYSDASHYTNAARTSTQLRRFASGKRRS